MKNISQINNKKIKEVISQIDKLIEDDKNNIFISKDLTTTIDIEEKVGSKSPLYGVPITLKDNILVKDKITTAGSYMLKDYVAHYDATITKRIKEANMIVVGKSNMDEFAMGSQTNNDLIGMTLNPRNNDYIVGGSSGGSAAAVSAGITPISIGTDTGGSIRQPAALNGILGMKPTYGRVSRYGVISFASSFDTIGIFSNDILDNAKILEVISGSDGKDAMVQDHPKNFASKIGQSIEGMKIGFLNNNMENIDSKLLEELENIKNHFIKEGAEVQNINIDYMEQSLNVYATIAYAESSSNLARFDGIRYGYKNDDAINLKEQYELNREKFGTEVKKRIILGTDVLSNEKYEKYYIKAQKIRRLISESFDNAFKDVDIIIMPTLNDEGQKINSDISNYELYMKDMYTMVLNMAGIPGMSIPSKITTKENMKFGIQVVSDKWKEDLIYQVADNILRREDV